MKKTAMTRGVMKKNPRCQWYRGEIEHTVHMNKGPKLVKAGAKNFMTMVDFLNFFEFFWIFLRKKGGA